ncbi:MAG: NUDIX domain-containing protein [Candidatus Nanopelagicales bacterium]
MTTDPIVAAGCLVTRSADTGIEVLVVHRPKYNDWSLPKGKQEKDEHITITAVREVLEETGVQVVLRQPLPECRYKVAGERKVVHFWRAEVATDNGFTATQEVDAIEWLGIADAQLRVTHQMDCDLIANASEPPAVPFILLRHGHAVKRAAWSGDDVERPLDPAGFAQSDALVPRLAVFGVGRVHSSAARRCLQTVEPYATARGLSVTGEPDLTEGAFRQDPDTATQRVTALMADAVRAKVPTILCGHRPYLPDLVGRLLEGSDLDGPQHTVPVGSNIVLYAVQRSEGSLTTLAVEHHRL